jgi:FtsP/CotA-like multicopper oxidase with cupredoxin domain
MPGGAPPNTGVTRSYDFTVSRGIKSSDGFQKDVVMVNDQFPWPLIEANWGDMIEVTVTNNIQNSSEGLSLHWHGQPQKLSPWYDGVPDVSQCPIALGKTFTYSFRAGSFGSSWYHSHVSSQYTDGLYGPLVIYRYAPCACLLLRKETNSRAGQFNFLMIAISGRYN